MSGSFANKRYRGSAGLRNFAYLAVIKFRDFGKNKIQKENTKNPRNSENFFPRNSENFFPRNCLILKSLKYMFKGKNFSLAFINNLTEL